MCTCVAKSAQPAIASARGAGTTTHFGGAEWACTCGAPLSWTGALAPVGSSVAAGEGIWRWASALPPVRAENRVTLGEPTTPLVGTGSLLCKLDFLLPTGSFKDRGSALLASCARELRAEAAVADSSGTQRHR